MKKDKNYNNKLLGTLGIGAGYIGGTSLGVLAGNKFLSNPYALGVASLVPGIAGAKIVREAIRGTKYDPLKRKKFKNPNLIIEKKLEKN
jgi:F0F1-type ATP synthase membrane subunit c/vacuolar-type H+-ATPase subunit K